LIQENQYSDGFKGRAQQNAGAKQVTAIEKQERLL